MHIFTTDKVEISKFYTNPSGLGCLAMTALVENRCGKNKAYIALSIDLLTVVMTFYNPLQIWIPNTDRYLTSFAGSLDFEDDYLSIFARI
jgi:hypothetical protein